MGDMRAPAVVWIMVTTVHMFHLVHEGGNAKLVASGAPTSSDGPIHALDFVERRLRNAQLLDARFVLELDHETMSPPRVYLHALPYRVVLPENDHELWRPGVAEAVIMHEVGHANSLCEVAYKRCSEHMRHLWFCAAGICAVAMCLYNMPHAVVAFTLLCICAACGIVHTQSERPLLHSIEFVADSHIANALGDRGVRAMMQYFSADIQTHKLHPENRQHTAPRAEHTHPAPQDRIDAFELFLKKREHIHATV
jgi:hypothetical protein